MNSNAVHRIPNPRRAAYNATAFLAHQVGSLRGFLEIEGSASSSQGRRRISPGSSLSLEKGGWKIDWVLYRVYPAIFTIKPEGVVFETGVER